MTDPLGDMLSSLMQTDQKKQTGVKQITTMFADLKPRGLLAVIAGAPGVGKSTLVSHFPGCEAVTDFRDQGLLDLAYEKLIPLSPEMIHSCKSFEEYVSTLKCVVRGDCQTVLIESIGGIQGLCDIACSRDDYYGDMSNKAYFMYQAGPRTIAIKYYPQVIDLALEAQERGKNCFMVGHTVEGTKPNLIGDDYLAATLGCYKEVAARINGSFSNVFVIADIPDTEKESAKGRAKVKEGATRYLWPHANPWYPSKNRLKLNAQWEFSSDDKQAYLDLCKQVKKHPTTGARLL